MAALTPAAQPRTAPVDVIFLPLPSGFRPADATFARRPVGGAGPGCRIRETAAASVCAVLAGIRREDRGLSILDGPPGFMAAAARRVTGLRV